MIDRGHIVHCQEVLDIPFGIFHCCEVEIIGSSLLSNRRMKYMQCYVNAGERVGDMKEMGVERHGIGWKICQRE